MKITQRIVAAIFIGLLGISMAACSGSTNSASTGEYVDDAAISTKVRTKIVADPKLSLFQIDVETFKSVVQLSGFVDTPAAKAHATRVAAGVDGVKSVKNDLIVK